MSVATLFWFRLDLRLADNPALRAAVARAKPLIPVFIWSPEEEGAWPPGAASRWWLHHSLASLDQSLRRRGSRLILRPGPALAALRKLAKETNAEAVLWNRRYEPALVSRDADIQKALQKDGFETGVFNSALLFEPQDIKTGAGRPFQVFTPFWRACLARPEPPAPIRPPRRFLAPSRWPVSDSLASLNLLPKIGWDQGIRATWQPGEAAGSRQLKRFLRSALAGYSSGREAPARPGTSRLSPYLHFGEISPQQVWHAVQKHIQSGRSRETRAAAQDFLRELGWREFAHHLLYHFPHTTDQPLRSEFARFQWSRNKSAQKAWQRGATGYPLVDAGMRELWATGWMHNRVRMVVASLLVKDLLLPWQQGARWFWDTLVDADLANNTLGWQWSAGCGADAAPFFRIFNPLTQGKKFDPAGEYIRRWVPELARLPAKWIHAPWEAPLGALQQAGVVLSRAYPKPIVDHAEARRRALAAFKEMRR